MIKSRKSIKISGIFSCESFIAGIYNLARKFRLSGWIKGDNQTARLEVEGENNSLIEFMSEIYDNKKTPSEIIELEFQDMPVLNSSGLYVIEEACPEKSEKELVLNGNNKS